MLCLRFLNARHPAHRVCEAVCEEGAFLHLVLISLGHGAGLFSVALQVASNFGAKDCP